MTASAPAILLVEDEAPIRGALRDALRRAGFDVDTAPTGADALQRLGERPYAVIAADCFLPDIGAPDWIAAIRGMRPEIPLVLFSGAVGIDALRRLARGWRASAVLEKPFAPAQLVAAIEAALAGSGRG